MLLTKFLRLKIKHFLSLCVIPISFVLYPSVALRQLPCYLGELLVGADNQYFKFSHRKGCLAELTCERAGHVGLPVPDSETRRSIVGRSPGVVRKAKPWYGTNIILRHPHSSYFLSREPVFTIKPKMEHKTATLYPHTLKLKRLIIINIQPSNDLNVFIPLFNIIYFVIC